MNFSNAGYILSFSLSFITIVAVVTYAFWIRLFLVNNVDRFGQPHFVRKYGEAYSGMK